MKYALLFVVSEPETYLLGQSITEQHRLLFQDQLWEDETEQLLDALNIPEGGRVLELGSGLGHSLLRLARRVGPSGEVIAAERDAVFAQASRTLAAQHRMNQWSQVMVNGSLSVFRDQLPQGPFDAIFARWVFSFLPQPAGALTLFSSLLRPGGTIGIMDYNHDGLRLFPEAPAFTRVVEAVRQWYANAGGDLWVAGKLPGALHKTGFHCDGLWPHQKAGPPGSGPYKWIEQFLLGQGPRLVDAGLIETDPWDEFVAEWESLRVDPATVIFCPIVVSIVAHKA